MHSELRNDLIYYRLLFNLSVNRKDFKNFRTNAKLSSPIELDASTTKYKSNLKSRGQPDPKVENNENLLLIGERGNSVDRQRRLP